MNAPLLTSFSFEAQTHPLDEAQRWLAFGGFHISKVFNDNQNSFVYMKNGPTWFTGKNKY